MVESKKPLKDLGKLGADKNESVKVAIRCRPLNDKEKAEGHQ